MTQTQFTTLKPLALLLLMTLANPALFAWTDPEFIIKITELNSQRTSDDPNDPQALHVNGGPIDDGDKEDIPEGFYHDTSRMGLMHFMTITWVDESQIVRVYLNGNYMGIDAVGSEKIGVQLVGSESQVMGMGFHILDPGGTWIEGDIGMYSNATYSEVADMLAPVPNSAVGPASPPVADQAFFDAFLAAVDTRDYLIENSDGSLCQERMVEAVAALVDLITERGNYYPVTLALQRLHLAMENYQNQCAPPPVFGPR